MFTSKEVSSLEPHLLAVRVFLPMCSYSHNYVRRLSSDPTSDLAVEVFQRSFLGKKHSSVGKNEFKLGELLDKSKNEGAWHTV